MAVLTHFMYFMSFAELHPLSYRHKRRLNSTLTKVLKHHSPFNSTCQCSLFSSQVQVIPNNTHQPNHAAPATPPRPPSPFPHQISQPPNPLSEAHPRPYLSFLSLNNPLFLLLLLLRAFQPRLISPHSQAKIPHPTSYPHPRRPFANPLPPPHPLPSRLRARPLFCWIQTQTSDTKYPPFFRERRQRA